MSAESKVSLKPEETLKAILSFINTPEFVDTLKVLHQKNVLYGASWETFGTFINASDIIDKLTRVVTYDRYKDSESLKIEEYDKYRDIIFDLFARSLMTLMFIDKK